MHNCKEIREQLNELVLSDEVLPAELDQCSECRSEFEAVNATLRMTRRLYEAGAPDEDYWTSYHARLRQKLKSPAKAQRRKEEFSTLFASFFAPLRLCAKTSVRVPVPLGIAIIILCGVLGVMAFRSKQQNAQPQNPMIVRIPMEVPVIKEKTVTQVVYRDQRPRSRNSNRPANGPTPETTFARSQKPRSEDIPPTLPGFKPNDEIKLTVIKGGSSNEQ